MGIQDPSVRDKIIQLESHLSIAKFIQKFNLEIR
jgi:hypothetical protein